MRHRSLLPLGGVAILTGCLLMTGCEKSAKDDAATPRTDATTSAPDEVSKADTSGETTSAANITNTGSSESAAKHDGGGASLADFGPPPPAGDVAPDIEGVDLDGVPFKLSDYKGKVIFLDFWGDW